MKKCKSCDCELEEGYDLKIWSGMVTPCATVKKGKKNYDITCAVCPKCKEVTFYIE